MTANVSVPDRTQAAPRSRAITRLGACIAAAVGAVVVWGLASVTSGELVANGAPILWWQFAVVALLASLAGWAALALLERFTATPVRWWSVLAGVVLLASMAGPLGSPGLAGSTRAWLVVVHLVVAAVLVPGLLRTARR